MSTTEHTNPDDAQENIIYLDWPAPKTVKACYTLRNGGCSDGSYASFNLGDHVDDELTSVNTNRQALQAAIGQESICWLQQIHTTTVVEASIANGTQADACYTHLVNQVCNVMTADCLPVFFCNKQGSEVAVSHAGWRGLHAGILQQTLRRFQCYSASQPSNNIMAYLGPAIGQTAFEVGDDVRDAFLSLPHGQLSSACQYFKLKQQSVSGNKWMADLYGLAKNMLQNMGVVEIYSGDCCTYSQPEKFFSYRRDGVTGRMANLIWLEKD